MVAHDLLTLMPNPSTFNQTAPLSVNPQSQHEGCVDLLIRNFCRKRASGQITVLFPGLLAGTLTPHLFQMYKGPLCRSESRAEHLTAMVTECIPTHHM